MYNKTMVKRESLRIFIWIELAIWILIVLIAIFAIRHHRIKNMKAKTSYQIFLQDVDGLIVGSPVKYMGVDIGFIDKIKIIDNDVYVKFIIDEPQVKLPQGVIATVEFYGLGGSKSLELYPPTQDSIASRKVIAVQKPKRLGDALVLLNFMFEKIDSIIERTSFFATETESIHPSAENAIHVNDMQQNVDKLDGWLSEIKIKPTIKDDTSQETNKETANEHE